MINQKKIRIAHIITRMDRGGAPDVVRILMEQLDPVLFETVLIYGRTQVPTGRVKEFLERLGPAGRRVDALVRDIHPFLDLKAFFAIGRILRREKFDIVHTHTSKAGFLGRVAARWAGVPMVVHSPHGHNFYGYFRALGSRFVVMAEKFAAQFCDKIHTLTQLEKKDMMDYGVAPEKKITTIYCGLELGRFQRNFEKAAALKGALGIPATALVAGFVGRLESVKGPKYFIRAAARVHKQFPDAHFLVAGEGGLRPRLEEEARRLGIWGVTHFIGWQEDAVPVYSVLDICVLTSLNEAVGRTILEAQSVGAAIIATKVGGVPEIVQDGVTGLLVNSRDAKSLAKAMARLIKSATERESLVAAGRTRVGELFSDKLMVSHFAALYREALLCYNQT